MTYEIHPLAELIPPMADVEFAELRASIKTRGYLDDEPVVIYEGKILDGRHRERAARELGITPLVKQYEGEDPTGYVLAKNLDRRHLTTGQRSAAALKLLDYEKEQARERQGERTDLTSPTTEGKVPDRHETEATAKAGAKLGVSRSSVERVRTVAENRPDLLKKVEAGEITVNAAVEETTGKSTKTGVRHDERLTTKQDASGRQMPTVYYGKGDKWQESTEPLTRYLAAQKKRGYDFSHLNYKEARKRVQRIDSLIEGLQAARADLEPRSHKAKLSF